MNKKTLGRNDSDDDFTMSMRSEPLGYTVKSQQLNNFSVHITGDIRDAEYYTKIFELCLDAGETILSTSSLHRMVEIWTD